LVPCGLQNNKIICRIENGVESSRNLTLVLPNDSLEIKNIFGLEINILTIAAFLNNEFFGEFAK
jgi:hypothetical protein